MATTETVSAAPLPQDRPDETREERKSLSQMVLQSGTIIALVGLIVIFGVLSPSGFLSLGNLTNILAQVAILTIIAGAQTIVMVTGHFDLSVGTTATLSGASASAFMLSGLPVPVAIILGLLVGLGVGMINGFLVAFLNISAIVATLATLTTVGGLAFIVTDGTTLYGMPEVFFWVGQSRIAGLPMPVVIALVVALVIWVVLKYTTVGRRWYAVGGNADVARLSGVSVRSNVFWAFALAGLVSGLGGIVLVSRLSSASATSANDYMMLAVAAVFLGMTLSNSGQANLGGTLVGVGIIGVLQNGLNIVGVNTYVQQVLTGIIIVAAVLLSSFKSRRA
ncbi:ABC transporter permease [Citricoccus nitrophenolicus]|uniref:Ribose transport system permease protein n=1 Tax=Citricoccus muralis TaxID=169134 RepID=A0A3D9LI52_9MICC|nr:ABC transporter permease [Citricoccus muralis]REE04743.1 ribose transport system permease protein [Citricoccus muralis]